MCFETPPTPRGERRYYCYWSPMVGWAGLRCVAPPPSHTRIGWGELGGVARPRRGVGLMQDAANQARGGGRGLGIPEDSLEILQRGGGEQGQHLGGGGGC